MGWHHFLKRSSLPGDQMGWTSRFPLALTVPCGSDALAPWMGQWISRNCGSVGVAPTLVVASNHGGTYSLMCARRREA